MRKEGRWGEKRGIRAGKGSRNRVPSTLGKN